MTREQKRSGRRREERGGTRFDRIHQDYRGPIMGYLRRLTRDGPLAEELSQETFLRVGRGLAGFKRNSTVATWIYRIATNVYIDHLRKVSGSPRRVEPWDDEMGGAGGEDLASLSGVSGPKLPDRLLERSEMGECIRGFVDSLPPDYRTVIILHDLEGFKNAEIAQVLGCSLEAIKIRIHRARRKLRELLSDHCDFYYNEADVLCCDRKQPRGTGES